jgi:citrate lyase subunit beta / citryl-CoA lyase
VWWVETLLDQIERRSPRAQPLKLEVLIEEVEALTAVDEIARCSPRLEAVTFGPGDLAAAQGVKTFAIGGDTADYPGDIWHYARSKIVVAARAAGIEAVDGPLADHGDADAYRRECVQANVLGFTGKWAIHPSQIPIANEVFAPTGTEEQQARRVIDEYQRAQASGVSSATVDGRMAEPSASTEDARPSPPHDNTPE